MWSIFIYLRVNYLIVVEFYTFEGIYTFEGPTLVISANVGYNAFKLGSSVFCMLLIDFLQYLIFHGELRSHMNVGLEIM